MKSLKNITAAVLALPLALGSVSVLAENVNTTTEQQTEEKGNRHKHMDFVFKGLELTKEQRQQFRANLIKIVSTPTTLELKAPPTIEERLAGLFEGIELTEEQKQRAAENFAKQEEFQRKIRDKVATVHTAE